VSIWYISCVSVHREAVLQDTIHTRVINATPVPPICLMTPCAVQYGPVVTIPSWAHRISNIPAIAKRRSYTKRESCDAAQIRPSMSNNRTMERTMHMSAGVRSSFQSPFGRGLSVMKQVPLQRNLINWTEQQKRHRTYHCQNKNDENCTEAEEGCLRYQLHVAEYKWHGR
jgi:hypothetical protein